MKGDSNTKGGGDESLGNFFCLSLHFVHMLDCGGAEKQGPASCKTHASAATAASDGGALNERD